PSVPTSRSTAELPPHPVTPTATGSLTPATGDTEATSSASRSPVRNALLDAEMLPVLRCSWPVAKLNRNTAAATTSSPINMPTRISSRENPPWSARWLVRGGRCAAIRRTQPSGEHPSEEHRERGTLGDRRRPARRHLEPRRDRPARLAVGLGARLLDHPAVVGRRRVVERLQVADQLRGLHPLVAGAPVQGAGAVLEQDRARRPARLARHGVALGTRLVGPGQRRLVPRTADALHDVPARVGAARRSTADVERVEAHLGAPEHRTG